MTAIISQITLTLVALCAAVNAGISAASARQAADLHERIVLIRPGTYMESVRVFADVTLIGLGESGAVQVKAQGWEPALVLGGFSVGRAELGDGTHIAAASAGALARVHCLSLSTRNQQQSVVVYCTGGAPTVTHCTIHGTVRVSGSRASPHFLKCDIRASRSCGMRICDHARGSVRSCYLVCNQLAAIRISQCATPDLQGNRFESNGHDGILLDAPEDSDDDGWEGEHSGGGDNERLD